MFKSISFEKLRNLTELNKNSRTGEQKQRDFSTSNEVPFSTLVRDTPGFSLKQCSSILLLLKIGVSGINL
jgi:hypothetical protein